MEESAMHGLSLEWKHCPDGVELVDLGAPKKRKEKRRMFVPPGLAFSSLEFREVEVEDHSTPSGPTFRPRTLRRYPIRHSINNLENPIALQFVNAQDDEARAGFLAAFGFLYKQDQDLHPHDEVLGYQQHFRKLLVSAGSDEPDEAAINKYLRADLVPVLTGRRLSFALHSLVGVMLREIVMAVEKDARFTTCLHCHKAFLTGPTTGRRSHASYCSDRCRVAAMRARNAR
jgi:hypothetical protein